MAPRLTSPPLVFYVPDRSQLATIAQLELAQYFYGYPLEEILKYQANRHETLDEMEIEFKPKKPEEAVSQQADEEFWALRQSGVQLTAYAAESALSRAPP